MQKIPMDFLRHNQVFLPPGRLCFCQLELFHKLLNAAMLSCNMFALSQYGKRVEIVINFRYRVSLQNYIFRF
jgi:hypothetical protein